MISERGNMETFTKSFILSKGCLVPELDILLTKAGWLDETSITKSAAAQISDYKLYVRTFDSMNTYKLYTFSLNELEAEFDAKSGDITSLTLRNTSVHKKLSFNAKGTTLTNVKGQDTVGQHSEVNYLTTREPVFNLNINGTDFNAPFEMGDVYEYLTGLNVNFFTEDDIEEERSNQNLWNTLVEQLKEA
jgi:hypothetical protein